MILGDNDSARRNVGAWYSLPPPEEGRRLGAGLEHPEVVFARVIAETQVVVGGVETRSCTEDGGEENWVMYPQKGDKPTI